MKNDLKGLYFIKTDANGKYSDMTTLFDGVRVLAVDGFFKQGEAVNIYNEQWVNSQKEDFYIADKDEDGNPKVIRKNIEIDITFVVGQRYASSQIDVGKTHDAFVRLLTHCDVWIQSNYTKKEVHCINIEKYDPTTVKLCRGENSFIMGTIKLHALDTPTNSSQSPYGEQTRDGNDDDKPNFDPID